ncbi:MAG: nickel pincer cofactor biosynthesis protein LarC [Lachnospiraceae bacterium]|nr:nickel pincer cofactor biosynthesis protein LarC [Lachnospiraceae bacterium]
MGTLKKRSLYLECETGISGDMMVAALLDLGADQQVLLNALEGIRDDSFEIKISRVEKSGIDCCDFNVVLDAEHENHDHDMNYLFGHRRKSSGSSSDHEHHHHHHHHSDHEEESGREHYHHSVSDDEHEKHEEHQHGRNLGEIKAIIKSLDITEGARTLAFRIFDILADAEAKAHDKRRDEVHFHEVGAIDSIVDIVATAVCFDNLNIGKVVIKRMNEGHGSIRCQHGILQIPVPAVANIIESYGLPVAITERRGELITPTGAAIAAAVMTSQKMPKTFTVIKEGMGAGKRAYSVPSILKAMMFEENEEEIEAGTAIVDEHINEGHEEVKPMTYNDETISDKGDRIIKLECNMDDCSGEVLGYVMDELMKAGARDVFYTPVYMKKNRPGYLLSVITTADLREELEYIIFKNTTTIGIRRQEMERTVMDRENVKVMTKFGEGEVKVCTFKDIKKVYPEYESAKILAEKSGLSLDEIFKKLLDSYSCLF